MNRSTIEKGPWYLGSSFLMLITLTVVYLISTYSGASGPFAYVVSGLSVVAVLLGVRRVTKSLTAFRVGAVFGLLMLLFSVAHANLIEGNTQIWDVFAALSFFLVPVVALTFSLARATDVTTEEIFTACSLYILIGICFGLVFVIVYYFDPAAFTLSEADLERPGSSLIHFSMTTLTTVGYGAISPVSRTARTLSDIEAILAQLYLAIVIARLVSLEVSNRDREAPNT